MSTLGKNDIVIHVTDENRGLTKDVVCNRQLLVDGMAYFRSYLTGSSTDDVDISVHCDVHIFEWLVRYLKSAPGTEPKLGVRNVISILISSDFLQMDKLVTECISFFHQNINEIVKIPIDLACISQKLVTRLAGLFTLEELDAVDDPKDKILSRLNMNKLEEWLGHGKNAPHLCVLCGQLYPQFARAQLPCQMAPTRIDVHGQVRARHQPDPEWSLEKYMLGHRQNGRTWTEILWHLWGISQLLPCSSCNRLVPLTYWLHCSYHPFPASTSTHNPNSASSTQPKSLLATSGQAAASLLSTLAAGTMGENVPPPVVSPAAARFGNVATALRPRFPCCGRECTHWPHFDRMNGCQAHAHRLDAPTDAQHKILELARRHASSVLQPFQSASSASVSSVTGLGRGNLINMAGPGNSNDVFVAVNEFLFALPVQPIQNPLIFAQLGSAQLEHGGSSSKVNRHLKRAQSVNRKSSYLGSSNSKRDSKDDMDAIIINDDVEKSKNSSSSISGTNASDSKLKSTSPGAQSQIPPQNPFLRYESLTGELDPTMFFWPQQFPIAQNNTAQPSSIKSRNLAPNNKSGVSSTFLASSSVGGFKLNQSQSAVSNVARMVSRSLLEVDPSWFVHPYVHVQAPSHKPSKHSRSSGKRSARGISSGFGVLNRHSRFARAATAANTNRPMTAGAAFTRHQHRPATATAKSTLMNGKSATGGDVQDDDNDDEFGDFSGDSYPYGDDGDGGGAGSWDEMDPIDDDQVEESSSSDDEDDDLDSKTASSKTSFSSSTFRRNRPAMSDDSGVDEDEDVSDSDDSRQGGSSADDDIDEDEDTREDQVVPSSMNRPSIDIDASGSSSNKAVSSATSSHQSSTSSETGFVAVQSPLGSRRLLRFSRRLPFALATSASIGKSSNVGRHQGGVVNPFRWRSNQQVLPPPFQRQNSNDSTASSATSSGSNASSPSVATSSSASTFAAALASVGNGGSAANSGNPMYWNADDLPPDYDSDNDASTATGGMEVHSKHKRQAFLDALREFDRVRMDDLLQKLHMLRRDTRELRNANTKPRKLTKALENMRLSRKKKV